MRIVFVGAVEFSRHALEKILSMGANVVGVCTLQESKFNAEHVDLTKTCASYGIPCLYTEDINSNEARIWIEEKHPEVIFCFGWSRLIKAELLNVAPMGVVGFHPSALPTNRGRHPIIWALVLGLEKTASTFFFMDEGADTGNILSQRDVVIKSSDNAGSLYKKISQTAMEQIEEFLPSLTSKTYSQYQQDEGLANSWRKRTRDDGIIDWRMSARTISNLVKALSKPYTGAIFLLNNIEITVWESEVVVGVPSNIEYGKVLELTSRGPIVKCGEDAICLSKFEPVIDLVEGMYL